MGFLPWCNLPPTTRNGGKREEAAQLFRESLERARSLAMPYDEALSHAREAGM